MQNTTISIAPPIAPPISVLTDNASECSAEVYTGDVCRSALLTRQNCIPGLCNNSTEVFIPSGNNQAELEQQVIAFLPLFDLLIPSPACIEAFVPFLCFFTFRLCNNSTGELFLPSFGECEGLTTETCAREFQTAASIMDTNELLQCQQLPDVQVINTGDCIGEFLMLLCINHLISQSIGTTISRYSISLQLYPCRPHTYLGIFSPQAHL